MRAIIQRVPSAAVTIEDRTVAEIGCGLLILIGIEDSDGPDDIAWLAPKIARMRIFPDESGLMNLALGDTGGNAIVVSQFTLHASTKKGNRPSFLKAARPEISQPLYEAFCHALEQELALPIGRGRFGADMQITLVNDGPVTIVIDTKNRE